MAQTAAVDARAPQRIQSKLKAERIQEKLKAERIQQPLEAERIQERLAELPGWRLDAGAAALSRTYELPTLAAAGHRVQLVLAIAEATGYAPEIDLRGREVTVRVATTEGEGVCETDLEWAELLDGRR